MWVITDALGRPVVPEVKIVKAVSPSRTRPVEAGSQAGAAAASSSRSGSDQTGGGASSRSSMEPASSGATTTAFAALTRRLWLRVRPRCWVLRSAVTPPSLASAPTNTRSSAELGDKTATTSPNPIPRADSAWATRLTSRFNWRHDRVCVYVTTAAREPCRRALRSSIQPIERARLLSRCSAVGRAVS